MFSDFGLISDFSTSTSLKIIFKIKSLERVLCDFMTDSDCKKEVLLKYHSFNSWDVIGNAIIFSYLEFPN